jgi:hypothetical protein
MMNFLDDMKPKDLRKHIHNLMVTKEEKKPLMPTDYVRASGIFDFCPREEILCSKYNIIRYNEIPERLWKTFRFGRVFESFFRDELLGDNGIVIGKWACRLCTFTQESQNGMTRYAKPKACPVCGGSSFSYVEDDLVSEDGLIGGHPDGFLHWNSQYAILELKTANDMNFGKVRRDPMPKHIAQVQVYMHLTGYKEAKIFYFNKDSSEDVMHDVCYSEADAMAWVKKAQTWRDSLVAGKTPDRICPGSDCPRAKKCQVRQLCFSI